MWARLLMKSEKPKTQRLPKKKPQEEALKLAKLKQKIKPQPEPKKPRTVAKITAPMKKRMKPIRGAMVEASQTSKPCLLYTSPSPRDGLLSRMPSSA